MSEQLKRRIGLGLLTAYGVGVMVGAGIYVLVGAVAEAAGLWAPLAFLIAGAIAAPTALSYAEWSARVPEAAGEAAYIRAGLNMPRLAVLVGLAIVLAGTISAAAVLRGGVGYLTGIVDLPVWAGIAGLGLVLILVAALGVLESLGLAALFTAIELTGLGLIVWAGAGAAPVPGEPAALPGMWTGIGAGALLAFFAFIGFEDMVNMAEEVRNPTRTLPRAILLSLLVTTVLYALVAWAAVRAVPVAALAASEQPLALVWQQARGGSAGFLSAIAVFAALNGVLAQVVMAARVLFGLGKDGGALGIFHHAHPRFGTPVLGTVLVGLAVIGAALALPVEVLAGATSTVLLAVFVLINAALVAVKRRVPGAPFRVPMAVPVAGVVLSALALIAGLAGQG
ncbi:APC family permease [Salipiger sp. P9]|uniref:APC family permease n=1 Tax=Salipiger pentaromativorans TaxID=2943193 RepID=UPI0021578B4B|nr:APC family permease [Salipiger pentaromativorans]MCR8546491.1 APC family permease [Salipiger pentaromativorans]